MAKKEELHGIMSFNELIQNGLLNGANVNSGMPWSWKINGKSITHENDNCYIIETIDGIKRFERGDFLIVSPTGLKIHKIKES